MFNDKYIIDPKGLPLVSFYKEIVPEQLPYVFTGTHYHSDFELIYISSGSAKMKVGENEFTATAGSLVLVNPYEVHYGEITEKPFHYYCVDFNLNLFPDDYEENLLQEEKKYRNHVTSPSFEHYIKNIYEAYEKEPLGWRQLALGNLFLLFSKLEGELYDTYLANANDFTKNIVTYIRENFRQPITSHSAAEHLSYNHSHFCRLFKKNFSVSFCKYVRSVRIRAAKELLRKENVSAVAMKCGFSSISYFSKEFKEENGITPHKYRSMYKQKT
ncbi:MAG: AraC family transcriptional regulator [Clostridia bacterium]|nr:AraC family transcriptional regulator [Clostridia bacterium]